MNRSYDALLIVVTLFLMLSGTIIIYSTRAIFMDSYFLPRHFFHLGIGFGACLFALYFDYRRWEKYLPWLMLGILGLLVMVIIPGIGHEVNGGRRWLRLGSLSIQPAELLKFVLILYVASYLTRKQHKLSSFVKGLGPNFVMMGIFLSLVLFQPDFGTTVLISLTLLLMLYVGGGKPLHVFGSIMAFSVLAGFLVLSNAYRVRRLMSFMDPWQDPLDSGFQIIQSFIAIGSGGLFGKGLGEGRQKLLFLPDAHTDFIFSIWGEELGFVGTFILIALFALFVWRGFHIAANAEDSFGRYLAFGITANIGLQIILNLFVVTGMLPTKGLPLPFISVGGTSLLTTMLMTGVLLSISRGKREPQSNLNQPFYQRDKSLASRCG